MTSPVCVEGVLGRLAQSLRAFYQHSVIKNASFLLLSNIIMSGFGFLFWVIAAREYSRANVGVASVIITAAALITTIGLLGLDAGVLRFLSASPNQEKQLQSTVAVVTVTTILAGASYIALTPILSPKLAFIRHNLVYAAIMLGFIVALVLNAILQASFVAKRRSLYVLIGNSLFSVAKVGVVPFMMGLGSFGIIGASGIAVIANLLFGVVTLKIKFGIRLFPRYHRHALAHVRTYATTLFATGLENNLIQAALPLVVLNRLGAGHAGDYYIVLSVASTLNMFSAATFQSLLAEGAHSPNFFVMNVRHSARHVFMLLIPSAILMFFLGKYVLLLFGSGYAAHGTTMLKYLALAAPFSALNYLADGISNVQQRNRRFLVMSTFNSGGIIILSIFLVRYGLNGLGEAWLIAQAATTVVYAFVMRNELSGFLRQQK